MTAIDPLSPAVRDYLQAFDLAAIARTRDGQLITTRDPVFAAAAWWLPANGRCSAASSRTAGVLRRLPLRLACSSSSMVLFWHAPPPRLAGSINGWHPRSTVVEDTGRPCASALARAMQPSSRW